jgi:hypothetical protein
MKMNKYTFHSDVQRTLVTQYCHPELPRLGHHLLGTCMHCLYN